MSTFADIPFVAEDHVVHVAAAVIQFFLLHRIILPLCQTSPGQYMCAAAKSCTKKGKPLRKIYPPWGLAPLRPVLYTDPIGK